MGQNQGSTMSRKKKKEGDELADEFRGERFSPPPRITLKRSRTKEWSRLNSAVRLEWGKRT